MGRRDLAKTIPAKIPENVPEIRPMTQDSLDAFLEVYRLREDFLALAPVASASMDMVLEDIEIAINKGACPVAGDPVRCRAGPSVVATWRQRSLAPRRF